MAQSSDRKLSRKLAAGLILGLVWHASLSAAEIDRLGRDCGAGNKGACNQLASLARTSREGPLRRMAAERLIKERSRDCPPASAEHPPWQPGHPVYITSEYLFEHELKAGRQAEIVKAGDQLAASAIRSLGLDAAGDQDATQAVVAITVFGAARAWLFRQLVLDGSQDGSDDSVAVLLYPDVAWKGVVTVRVAGRCLCAEVLQEGAPRRDILFGSPRRKESDAPFRRDLESSLAPAMLRLGKDLYGTAAITRMAIGADTPKIRETALAQVRDQATLAEIARSDSDEHLRWAAVGRLTDQAALTEAARNDPSRNVRLQARSRLEKLGKSR